MAEKVVSGKTSLPAPLATGGMPLNEALKRRRSQRGFSDKGLTLEQISQLLWAAQGLTEPSKGFRTAPSAGALYPLEIYILEKGTLYHYLPASHSIEVTSRDVDAGRLADAAVGQQFVGEAPAVFVIGAVFERTRAKYGEEGDRYVHMEAGHAAQNLLLEAVSLGLGAVPVGSFYEKTTGEVLSLPAEVSPLYLIPVGYPAG
ncbi:MAG: SagB/ThcOx family dehydrogenase [Actinobacteria bacterium]|nr:SagB/ThcOx family dehydrogenase [Actinomycetota bacterium]